MAQEAELEFAEAVDFCGLDAPAQIDATAKDAGVRAGNVDEDAVEQRLVFAPLLVGRGEGGVRLRELLLIPLRGEGVGRVGARLLTL